MGEGVLYGTQMECSGLAQFLTWAGVIYALVTKAIIILRVSAMFSHPKRTTYVLSLLYLLIVIEAFVVDFVIEGPGSGVSISTAAVPIFNISACSTRPGRISRVVIYANIPPPVFDLLLFALALYRFAVHSMEAREMLGRPRASVYMRLLFEHSVVYFFFNSADQGLQLGLWTPPSWLYTTLATLYCSIVPYVLYPRLVLSLKSHRSQSDGLYVASDGPQSPRSPQLYVTSSGGLRSGEYELSELRLPCASKHA